MADSTAVVTAGAAVAIASSLITWRATKAGQQRLFRHQSRLADRQELRVLVDEAEAMNKVERGFASWSRHTARARGPRSCAAPRAWRARRRRSIASSRWECGSRSTSSSPKSCREASAHGLSVLGAVNRHAVLPSVADPPRFQFLADELAALEREAERFAALAQRRLGAFVVDDE